MDPPPPPPRHRLRETLVSGGLVATLSTLKAEKDLSVQLKHGRQEAYNLPPLVERPQVRVTLTPAERPASDAERGCTQSPRH